MKKLVTITLKGLVVILPIGVTIWVVYWLVTSIEQLLAPLLGALLPEGGWLQYRPGMGIVLALVLIFAIGLLSYVWLFRWVMELVDHLLKHIPLVKSLYGGLRDLMDFVGRSGDPSEQTQRVVMIKFTEECRLIGMVTREDFENVDDAIPGKKGDVAVYVPMSYQLGGFTFIVPESWIEPVDMTVEEAMRFAITAGVTTRRQSPITKPPTGKDE
jgi:uncharacterized membrane protein